jgi:hypothetical protein
MYATSIQQTDYEVIMNNKGIYGNKTNNFESHIIGISDKNKIDIDKSGLGVMMYGAVSANDFITTPITQIVSANFIGWIGTPLTTNAVYYKKVGKTVLAWGTVLGKSNATSTSIGGFPTASVYEATSMFVYRATDSETTPNASYGYITAGSPTINFAMDMSNSNWSSSAIKRIDFRTFYSVD